MGGTHKDESFPKLLIQGSFAFSRPPGVQGLGFGKFAFEYDSSSCRRAVLNLML